MKQRRWVEAMIGYCIPAAEIRRLIEDPHSGKPIDLETLREHFAKEISTGAVKANLQVAPISFLRRSSDAKAGHILCQGSDGLDRCERSRGRR
jgi:hypothetical protein